VRFGRKRNHYKATLRHLVTGLIINKSISTTKVKAKEASRLADRLVTIGKRGSVSNRRRAYSILQDRDMVSILFKEIAPLFKDRNGGYTRVMLTNRRRGDNAQMAILEFVEKPKKEVLPKKEEKKEKSPVHIEPEKTRPEKKERPKPAARPEKKERPEPIKPKKEPKKIAEPEKKPGFFKKLFGRKKDM
jgi:large subunit ribosomal protein L17